LRAEIKVSGIVQGVGFRPFIYRIAVKNGLVGYVRNRGDAVVEIVVEGKKNNVSQFLKDLKDEKPPLARIYDLTTNYRGNEGNFEKFSIVKSSEEVELSGSVIPPDVSVCNECLKELRDPKNERYDYFFITCTNCGPRYTKIRQIAGFMLRQWRVLSVVQKLILRQMTASSWNVKTLSEKQESFWKKDTLLPLRGTEAFTLAQPPPDQNLLPD
jgi:acylphosphatase